MELPEKAVVLRVIIAELGRVASHLVGMGTYGLDLGTFSPFLYAFREREIILDLFEEACGAGSPTATSRWAERRTTCPKSSRFRPAWRRSSAKSRR